MSTLTKESLDEMVATMRRLMPQQQPSFLDLYGSMPIFEIPDLTETETYTETVQLTWKERLWDPLKHGITMPFEPWVKTREVLRTREVPSRKIMVLGGVLFCHPVMKSEIFNAFQSNLTA